VNAVGGPKGAKDLLEEGICRESQLNKRVKRISTQRISDVRHGSRGMECYELDQNEQIRLAK
jgi:hypothetical protein